MTNGAKLASIAKKADLRPEPPEELSPRQAEIWRETTRNEPSDWFDTGNAQHLLADYCRHRSTVESLSVRLKEEEAHAMESRTLPSSYMTLLRLRDAESKAAAKIAVLLRLTNQSRYTPKAAKTATTSASKGARPWEI